MNRKSTLIKLQILVLVILTITSCKKSLKYPEDPKRTRATPEERLEGKWKITDYTFNGVSIYEQLNMAAHGSYNLSNLLIHYEPKKSENYDQGVSQIRPFNNTVFYLSESTFKLSVKEGEDTTAGYWLLSPFRYTKTGSTNWKVSKLYGTDFKLVLNTDSGEYKIHWNHVPLSE